MKIRIINEQDWEKIYDLDKSIIRVGSQLSCDIQLSGNDIQPMLMQFVRAGGKEVKYVLRIFSDNVKISRGDHSFPGQQMVPYEVLDGDKLIFGSYRMIIGMDDDQTRIRSSKHMEAKMYIDKRELSLDSPINGVLRLKNTGTDKACQFRIQIRGIPSECLRTAPMPYLYPGGKSTVGFMISHLQTKPQPGFQTVSIVITAPDDYFGEMLEFRQDIFINPVFKNEITLEDDSDALTGFNKAPDTTENTQTAPEPLPAVPFVQETARMIPGQAVIESEKVNDAEEKPPVVISAADTKNAFKEEADEENEPRRRRSSKKQKINVIHYDSESQKNVFEDEASEADESDTAGASAEEMTAAETVTGAEETVKAEPAPAEAPAEPESSVKPEKTETKAKKNTGRKKKTVPAEDHKTSVPAEDSETIVRERGSDAVMPEKPELQPAEETEKSAEPEPAIPEGPEPQPAAEAEKFAEPEAVMPEEPEVQPAVEAEKSAEPEPAMPEEPEPQPAEEAEKSAEPEPVPEADDEDDDWIPDAGPKPEDEDEPDIFAAAETMLNLSDTPEKEEKPAVMKTGRSRENGQAKEDKDEMIKDSGAAQIPVVHRNNSFDFTAEEEAPAPLPEKEPEVRVVKRGSFDD